MLNRWSLLMLTLGALVGYTFTNTSVQAQADALPFAVGETVTLWYGKDTSTPSYGTSVECAVAEIRGAYVRCGPRNRVGGGSDRGERWFTLKYVVLIAKRED
jgi:hypothetical protein